MSLDPELLARAIARVAEVGPPTHVDADQAEEHWRSYLMEATAYAREYHVVRSREGIERPDVPG